jgi:uncharacterized protein
MDVGRSGDVQTAGESVVEYSEACEVRDAGRLGEWQDRLDRIAEYNAYDCRSTLGLRDWLVARAAEAGVAAGTAAAEAEAQQLASVSAPGSVSAPAARELPLRVGPPDGAPPPEEDDLVQRLLAVADGGPTGAGRSDEQQAVAMLAAAVGYHWREAKPHWWAHFDRLVSDPTEWTDRRNTFLVAAAEVVEPWHTPPGKRTPRRHLRLVGRLEPGSSLTRDDQVCALYDRPVPRGLSTTVEGLRGWTDKVAVLSATAELSATTGASGGVLNDVLLVEERVGAGGEHEALPMALTPGPPLRTDGIAAAIRGLAEQVAAVLTGPLPDQPALDLLRRRGPRTRSGALPSAEPGGYVAAITAAAADLDGSYLAVQGPPGTGKTYTGARVIAALVDRGWRVGVVAQSHTVVENMLREVAGAGVDPLAIGKKPRPGELPDDDAPWHWIHKDRFPDFYARQPGGYVVGGTAWDFTTPARMPDRPLDLLVVDEAGQFALADTLAVSTAARNLLLLGDPQQLPQVTQGRHPEPVDCSALGWLTNGHDTLPAGLGYFLAHTWRMHPALCAVVSRLSYEGRLSSVGPAAGRSLDDVAPGVECVLVDHDGNSVASVEEAAEVVRQVRAVLGRRWRDPAAGVDRPLDERDVVVVAAYNAQVWTVRTALDAAGLRSVRVGTVDRFQGQQAVIVVLTTAASSPADVPRGMGFLLDRNRVNVAISRAQWRAVVVRSSGLTDYLPRTPDGLAELGAFLGICTAEPRRAAVDVSGR